MATDTMMDIDDDTALIAERIKQARTDAGMSRKGLSDATGISARTIERIENGEQEVTVQRLKLIASATDKPLEWLQGADDVASPTQRGPEPVNRPTSQRPKAPTPPSVAEVLAVLAEIDTMRGDGFDGMIRRALATVAQAEAMLSFLEPAALVEIATTRGIDRTALPKPRELQDRLETVHAVGLADCKSVQDRIIDTAVIGADLHEVATKTLEKIADLEGIESDEFLGGWSTENAVITAVRPAIRRRALTDQRPPELAEFMIIE